MALSFALTSLALSNPGDTQTCQKISVRVHSRPAPPPRPARLVARPPGLYSIYPPLQSAQMV